MAYHFFETYNWRPTTISKGKFHNHIENIHYLVRTKNTLCRIYLYLLKTS